METSRPPGALHGKVAMLTGAPANLCRSLASALHDEGAVAVVAGSHPVPATAQAFAALFEDIEREQEGIDIAIHVLAPFDEPSSPGELSLADYDAITDALVKTPFFLLQQSARRVRPDGKIIVVLAGTRQEAAQAGAAAAVQVYTRVLTREIGARGITVNTVSAPVDAHDHGFIDLIRSVVFLAGPAARWINAQTLRTTIARAGDHA